MIASNDLIGIGLYTPQEAARFARIRTETLNRWLYGDSRQPAVLEPRMGHVGEDRIVTFWDLIQAVALRNLRRDRKAAKVSMQHIRRVVTIARERYDLSYPFARMHTLYVYADRLIMQTKSGEYIGLDPKVDLDQLYHHRLVELFLDELRFDRAGLADQWTALQGAHDFYISLDPHRRFGMPIVEPVGVLVSALVDAVEAEGSIQSAAEAFEVAPEAVRLALKYDEYLAPAA